MRYFIGCLIGGEAKEYQEKLIDKICKKFSVRNLNKYVPPHFTLKSPFETEDILEVEKLFEKFCNKKKISEIVIDGIGSFDSHIIFLDGKPSGEAEETFVKLIEELGKVDWMQFREYELTDVNFHSTLARAKDNEQFEDIIKFLSNEKPFFDIKFDNLTIFESRNHKWTVYKKFNFI